MNKQTVSVCVCTYNPVKEKLIKTLDSILMQQDVDLQVVISDDGSKDNLFNVAREYFKKHKFSNYKLVAFEENCGTTINIIHGLEACDGFYVKPFSPGDLLIGKTCLSEWAKHLHESGRNWSVGNAVFYVPKADGKKEIISHIAYPQITKCYVTGDDRACRWNYVALTDTFCGATTLFETKLFLEYLKKLEGRVIYIEDTSYRLMMFDGIVADYYCKNVILYEFSTGISTNGSSIWNERIKEDWYASDEIMFQDVAAMDDFQKDMMNAYLKIRNRSEKSYAHKLQNIVIPGYLKLKLKRLFHPYSRMTPKNFNCE